LLYLFICKGRIPAYLGSSFAFIAPAQAVIASHGYAAALGGFIASGVVFTIVALIVHFAGTNWIHVVFPPAAMGAIVSVIGLELIPTAARMAGWISDGTPDWKPNSDALLLSVATLAITVFGSVLFRGFFKIIPILIGIVSGYILASLMGMAKFAAVDKSSFFDLPTFTSPVFQWAAIAAIVPASLVVIAEHVGHLIVTGNIVGKDLSKDPGLHRSMLGNGISTLISGFVGSTRIGDYPGLLYLRHRRRRGHRDPAVLSGQIFGVDQKYPAPGHGGSFAASVRRHCRLRPSHARRSESGLRQTIESFTDDDCPRYRAVRR
jgi:uracil permease